MCEEPLVERVRREVVEPLRALVLLAHARPHIRDDDVRLGDGLAGVADHVDARWLVAGRRRARELDTEQRTGGSEGDADVRPVPDPGDADALETTEPLPDSQQVGESLEGMLVVRQRVDDRHGRGGGELVDLRLPAVRTARPSR